MPTVMYSPQNHSRDMGPMRMLIHMYNKRTQWTIKDPWVLNRWKSIERKSKILLNRTSESSFQPFGNIQCWSMLRGSISCELYLLRGLCLWRLASKKSSRELQDSTTHSLRYFQSEMPFVGIIFRSTWKPFEPLQPQTSWESSIFFIPIIAKRDVYHGTNDRVTHHNKVTTPETRCHGSLAAAMVISFNSTGPYSNCFCLRRRHQRTNGTSVVKKTDVRI